MPRTSLPSPRLRMWGDFCYNSRMNGTWLDRERVEAAMGEYLARFDASNPKIALKVHHTYRVAELCERIAAEEGFDPALREVAWLVGMLHDIGRFVQLQDYDTFMDATSVDHAELGARMLFDEQMIERFVDCDECDPHVLDAMRAAIALHSAWRLPGDMDETTRILCTVLRDADKIDILRVNREEATETIYPFTHDELLDSELSEEVKDVFEARSTIRTSMKRLPADYALGHCAFGWELAFPSSKRIVIEQGYLRQLFDRPWRRQSTRDYFEAAGERMFDWLERTSSSAPQPYGLERPSTGMTAPEM